MSILLACALGTPLAFAADPSPTTAETGPATTSPTSVPQTSSPDTSTPVVTTPTSDASTTTIPGSPTSVATTTTTLAPGPTATDGSQGYATSPAPLIPSATSDPLFHAARTVDADLRDQAIANIDYLRKIAEATDALGTAKSAKTVADRAAAADRKASRRLSRTQSILRAAALHAYAGYGSMDTALSTPQTQGSETVLPYRTYVRVTIADATNHVEQAASGYEATHRRAVATGRTNQRLQERAAAAVMARDAAKRVADEATTRLARDRKTLTDLVGAMPDLGPGGDARLPEVTSLPAGATEVLSPAGTIVVPAEADPRTAIALQFIVAQMGKPYQWGGTGPNSYDCSGLMLRAFQAAGVRTMPRVSQGQQVWATPVDAKDVRPGDLVFFGTPAYHVGVYIGAGLMIDAPYTGSFVRVDRVWHSVSGYGRVVW